MGALDDLKKLVMEGVIEKDVELEVAGKKFSVTVSTLTLLEESSVLRESGLSEPPKNDLEMVDYTISLLSHCIKKLNGEPVQRDQVKATVQFMSGEQLRPIYDTYITLRDREMQAGEELKNS